MEAPYILSIQDFQDACTLLREGSSLNKGICKNCENRSKCYKDRRESSIDSILHMDQAQSRFPAFLKWSQVHPALLYSIPSSLYVKAYGSYHDSLPCPFISEEIFSHITEIESVYALLTNEVSKLTLLNVLMYRQTFDRDYILRAYSAEPQYFISAFRSLGSDEVFVDCGAFIGDSLESYYQYNHAPRSAYLFEPDERSIEIMEPIFEKYGNQTKIHLCKKGVHCNSGQLFFVKSHSTGSYISEVETEGAIPLPVTSIDDEISEDISFIKMDIEGSEYNALIGAKKHILSSYPKLAICVYHYPSDLWRIPLMIKDEFPNYTHFELRHHTRFFADTVLYVYR